jgi:hypothetical protein
MMMLVMMHETPHDSEQPQFRDPAMEPYLKCPTYACIQKSIIPKGESFPKFSKESKGRNLYEPWGGGGLHSLYIHMLATNSDARGLGQHIHDTWLRHCSQVWLVESIHVYSLLEKTCPPSCYFAKDTVPS